MSPSPSGHVALVLHAHLPYVRHPEHARSLEERWLHEALWETYLPLVEMLDRLENEGIVAPFSISVSPPLSAMWTDPMLRARSRAHLQRTRALAAHHRARMAPSDPLRPALEHHAALLERAEATLDRHGGDVLGAFAHHHRGGRIHLFTTTATHAFLPGLSPSPAWARAQIKLGLRSFEALTGIASRGMWLPECAFARWLDPLLAKEIGFTVLDAHGIALARPRPDVATIGRGAEALVVPTGPIVSAAGVTYFGRDLWAGRSVWAMNGYPSDPAYREFHRDVGFDAPEADLLGEIGPFGARVATGLKLHRITGPGPDKAPYDPAAGRAKAAEHALRFVADRARLFATLRSAGATVRSTGNALPESARNAPPGSARNAPHDSAPHDSAPHDSAGDDPRRSAGGGADARAGGPPAGAPPLSVVPFDAELFGHFWHEGPLFLEDVLRLLARSAARGGPAAITLAERHERHPATVRSEPAESTWGEGGFATTWTGPRTAALWRHVHHAGAGVLAHCQADRHGRLAPPQTLALEQAIVQTLLLQSSDFAFMIHRGTTTEYASRRAAEHAENARRLAALASKEAPDDADLAWIHALRERTPFLQELPGAALREALFTGAGK